MHITRHLPDYTMLLILIIQRDDFRSKLRRMFNGAHLPPCASMTCLPFLLLREAEAMAPSPLRPGNPGIGVELQRAQVHWYKHHP